MIISTRNVVYNLKLVSREYIRFKVVVRFVVLKSICGGSSRRVARYAGIDLTLGKIRSHISEFKRWRGYSSKSLDSPYTRLDDER